MKALKINRTQFWEKEEEMMKNRVEMKNMTKAQASMTVNDKRM
jgi:hypothetical protein